MNYNVRKQKAADVALNEANQQMLDTWDLDPRIPTDLQHILGDQKCWESYKGYLMEHSDGVKNENLDKMLEGTKKALLLETGISGLNALSAQTLPLLRKSWPSIGMKDAIPTEPVSVPKISIPRFKAFLRHPSTGEEIPLPAAYADPSYGTISERVSIVDTYATVLPLRRFDLLPVTHPTTAGHGVDTELYLTMVKGNFYDGTGAQAAVDVKVIAEQIDTRTGSSFIESSVIVGKDAGGDDIYRTMRVSIALDWDTGIVNVVDHAGDVVADTDEELLQVTHVKLKGLVDSSKNEESIEIDFRMDTEEFNIGTGKRKHINLPQEKLADTKAIYGLDAKAELMNELTKTVAHDVNQEGLVNIDEWFERSRMSTHKNKLPIFNFALHPGGRFSGTVSEYINDEFKRLVDFICIVMKQKSYHKEGYFNLLGNDQDIHAVLGGTGWAKSDAESAYDDGSQYKMGFISSANSTIKVVADQTHPVGYLQFYFIPTSEHELTYKYYPYAFMVNDHTTGYRVPNSNLPGVMITKRHLFKAWDYLHTRINIHQNDGTSPAHIGQLTIPQPIPNPNPIP